jgi:hypothetical protein
MRATFYWLFAVMKVYQMGRITPLDDENDESRESLTPARQAFSPDKGIKHVFPRQEENGGLPSGHLSCKEFPPASKSEARKMLQSGH